MQEEIKSVVGYTNKLSVCAGDHQAFMLSAEVPGNCQVELVELICGDNRPKGAGFQERHIESSLTRNLEVGHQPIEGGSYGVAVVNAQVRTICLCFLPTSMKQSTVAQVGALTIGMGETGVCVDVEGDGVLTLPCKLNRWHWIGVTFEGVELKVRITSDSAGSAERAETYESSLKLGGLTVLDVESVVLGATRIGDRTNRVFNGKVERPWLSSEIFDLTDAETLSDDLNRIKGAKGLVAAWDFSRQIAGDTGVDIGPSGSNLTLFNCPARAVKGRYWDGTSNNVNEVPIQYGAVYFHDDDLTDVNWLPTTSWQVPDDLPSAVYALKVTQDNSRDYIPFFVRPAPHHIRNRIAYLAPTATYLAYANQRLGIEESILSDGKIRNVNDAYLAAHKEVGLSLYEHHSDGSGVHYSSYLRPVLNLKPEGVMWAFNADTNITAWLRHLNEPFDVITDEDLHREGMALIEDYKVVITGTHPEYYSTKMLDAIAGFLENSGRLMYMGGNGFYWRIAHHPDNLGIIEVRRAEDGTRAWIAEPGEYFHSFTDEYGGMWRRQGRPPNLLVGIGFAAQGFDGGTYYRLKPGAHEERARFIFEGTSGDEVIGNYGSIEGGAASQEIDRWDSELGSPGHALVLASSENHRPGMLRVVEELHMSTPFTDMQGGQVRADMTFFETPTGGAVFSTGSIGYAGALAHDGYDNDICKITTNVLRRFIDDTPFKYPG